MTQDTVQLQDLICKKCKADFIGEMYYERAPVRPKQGAKMISEWILGGENVKWTYLGSFPLAKSLKTMK
jgi:hypothetical protein